MAPLAPTQPNAVTVFRQITANITTSSAPFLRFGLIKIGGRGTMIRLQSGSLAVFSPQALTDEWKERIAAQGNRLNYIAVLDSEHHMFLGDWAKAFPSAKIIGPQGLAEKRIEEKKVNVPITYEIKEGTGGSQPIDAEFDAEIEHEFVHVHPNKELVFFHKPERTLVQADLLFNLPATEQFSKSGEDPRTGILTKLFTSFQSTEGKAMGQRRFLWYVASKGDRAAFAKSIERINAWPFERIIPCHGDVIETDAKPIFQKLMAWHLTH